MFHGQKNRKRWCLSTLVPLSDKDDFQEKGTVRTVFQNLRSTKTKGLACCKIFR